VIVNIDEDIEIFVAICKILYLLSENCCKFLPVLLKYKLFKFYVYYFNLLKLQPIASSLIDKLILLSLRDLVIDCKRILIELL
jgi:hypothetical protein